MFPLMMGQIFYSRKLTILIYLCSGRNYLNRREIRQTMGSKTDIKVSAGIKGLDAQSKFVNVENF